MSTSDDPSDSRGDLHMHGGLQVGRNQHHVMASSAHLPEPEHEPLHKAVGGYSIYAGVVSAGIMAFRQDHGELRMHGGVPAGLDQHHLLVGLIEQKSGARVTDAETSVRVTGTRGTEEKILLHVPVGGEISYGNFFRMRPDERYRIDLNIRRAGGADAVAAAFEYRHRL